MNKPQDKILVRSAFRWVLNGEVCRWCYENCTLDYVLETHGLLLIEKIDENTAFVRGELR